MGSTGKKATNSTTSNPFEQSISSIENRINKMRYETAVVLDDNGNVIFEKTDFAEDEVTFSKEQLASMKNMTLTHNHPRSTTLSDEDINLLIKRQLKEIRAKGNDGSVAILTRNDMSKSPITKRFAIDYVNAFTEWDAKNLKPLWAKAMRENRSDDYMEKLADNLNKRIDEFRRNWLREYASLYGYTYTEKGKE